MTVYQAITADEYELPIAQADTLKELAEMLEVPYSAVKMRICYQYSGSQVGYKIIKITI